MSTAKYHYNKRTVLLEKHVYERLKTKGLFGETFSSLIERLLDEVDNKK